MLNLNPKKYNYMLYDLSKPSGRQAAIEANILYQGGKIAIIGFSTICMISAMAIYNNLGGETVDPNVDE